MSKAVIIGWIIELAGLVLWLYGYFTTGNPSLIHWHGYTPWWIADYLSNIESEIGMALVFAGMCPNLLAASAVTIKPHLGIEGNSQLDGLRSFVFSE